jgi:metal-sulfur cluster biosynthetic enzyme
VRARRLARRLFALLYPCPIEGRNAGDPLTMNPMTPEEIKELLRAVGCPGRSRDIVALKFVRGIGVQGSDVRVEFAPDTVKADKVQAMEDGIRRVLGEAGFTRVDIET